MSNDVLRLCKCTLIRFRLQLLRCHLTVNLPSLLTTAVCCSNTPFPRTFAVTSNTSPGFKAEPQRVNEDVDTAQMLSVNFCVPGVTVIPLVTPIVAVAGGVKERVGVVVLV